jgi:hypothetical protein
MVGAHLSTDESRTIRPGGPNTIHVGIAQETVEGCRFPAAPFVVGMEPPTPGGLDNQPEENAMPKYVLAYHGGTTPKSEADQAAVMGAWGAWFGVLGDAVIDGGAPTSASRP